MVETPAAAARRARALIGLVVASALVYPLLICAWRLVIVQLFAVDAGAIALWLSLGVLCSVAVVAAVRWGAARRVRSPWLLLGLAPPALFELWLVWPQVAG
jgi:hypothetical protein